MALLNVIRGEESKILSQPVSDGALLFATDTKKIYLDKGSERIEIASMQDLSDYVTNEELTEGLATKAPLSHSHTVSQVTDLDATISAAIGEEASARQKQDQLLEQAIEDKLGADDIVAGSNVQVSHDEASGHVTISATDTKYAAGAGLTLSGTEFGVADGGIIGRYLDDNCVMERNIVVGSVTSDKIPALAITTPKLADNAVTAIKMADDAVATRSIQNRAVTADKIADGVIPDVSGFITSEEASDAYAAKSHTHDDRYYTESETNNLLAAKANTSHTHSYLPLSGGTLTGTLTSRAITPSATNTYNIGTSSMKFANVYATTFVGALSGNATTATTATKANQLTTARTITASLSSSTAGSFNGTTNITVGTTGTLPISKGGTGATTAAAARSNLAAAPSDIVLVQSAQPTSSTCKLWIKI